MIPTRETIVADIFERRRAESYLGEPVTMAQHVMRGATLAEAEGVPDELIAPALLHDFGRYTSELGPYAAVARRTDERRARRHL